MSSAEGAQDASERRRWIDGSATWHGWVVGRFWLPALVVLALVVGASWLGTMDHVIGPEGVMDSSAPTMRDYRDTTWLPVRDVLSGGNPYDAPSYQTRHPYALEFTYLPAQLTIFAPVAALSLYDAVAVWFALLIVAVVALAALTLSMTTSFRRLDLVLVLAAAIIVTRPLAFMIEFGNTSIIAILGTTVALVRRRPDVLTTLGVAAAWLKPQFGVPLVVILLVLELRKPVLRGTLIAAILSLPAVVWVSVNAGGLGAFLASLPKALHAAFSSEATRPTHGFVLPDLGALLTHLTEDRISGPVTSVVVLVVVLGVGALGVVRARASTDLGAPLGIACALTTIVLCSPHGSYDMVLLVPALAACILALLRATGWVRACIGLAAICMALVLVPDPGFAVREFQLTLLILVVGSAAAYTAMSGSRRRRLLVLCTTVCGLLVLRYVVGLTLEPQIMSGLVAAVMLLIAWISITAAALGASRPDAATAGADVTPGSGNAVSLSP